MDNSLDRGKGHHTVVADRGSGGLGCWDVREQVAAPMILRDEAKGKAMNAAELVKRYSAGERAFPHIDLCWANLQRAKLRGAYLRGAYLRWANLRGADLRWTDLTRASLAGANLTGASLRWAYLVEADLRGAIVADEQLAQAATLKGAILPDGTVHE